MLMRTQSGVASISKALFLFALLAGVAAAAQQPAAKQPKPAPSLEVTYDYMHSNGPPGGCGCFNLNGAGGAVVFPMKIAPVAFVGGVDVAHGNGISASNYGLTLVTYTVGVRYLPKLKSTTVQPYGEVQLGGAHASGTLASTPSAAGSGLGSAFAGTIGGGLDLRLHHGISLKLIDAEYVATTFPNGVNNHQNNLRIRAGLTFSLCGAHCVVK